MENVGMANLEMGRQASFMLASAGWDIAIIALGKKVYNYLIAQELTVYSGNSAQISTLLRPVFFA